MLERQVSVETDAPVEALHAVVADLMTYPEWLDIVHEVDVDSAHPGDPGPAWSVTLRAQVGRFARSKRLRIVQTVNDAPELATFGRRELDDREHADWVMRCSCIDLCTDAATTAQSRLDLDLTYTGRLWSTLLDAVLGDEIERAVERLPAYVASR